MGELHDVPGLSTIILAAKLGDAAQRKARGKPTRAEQTKLVQFAKTLDNRRVFYVSLHEEAEAACLGSLDGMLRETEATLVAIEHADATMILQALQTVLRAFLDRWRGFHAQRRAPHEWDRRPWHMRGEREARFFFELGALRQSVCELIQLLIWIEPKVTAPNLLGEEAR